MCPNRLIFYRLAFDIWRVCNLWVIAFSENREPAPDVAIRFDSFLYWN